MEPGINILRQIRLRLAKKQIAIREPDRQRRKQKLGRSILLQVSFAHLAVLAAIGSAGLTLAGIGNPASVVRPLCQGFTPWQSWSTQFQFHMLCSDFSTVDAVEDFATPGR